PAIYPLSLHDALPIFHRQKPGPMRRQNSYATPTPVTDGERVYAVFYDGTVTAVDLSGKPVWKNQEIDFFSLHGLGASPVLAGGQDRKSTRLNSSHVKI